MTVEYLFGQCQWPLVDASDAPQGLEVGVVIERVVLRGKVSVSSIYVMDHELPVLVDSWQHATNASLGFGFEAIEALSWQRSPGSRQTAVLLVSCLLGSNTHDDAPKLRDRGELTLAFIQHDVNSRIPYLLMSEPPKQCSAWIRLNLGGAE